MSVDEYLNQDPCTDLIHASLYVDGCVDVGGVLTMVRYKECGGTKEQIDVVCNVALVNPPSEADVYSVSRRSLVQPHWGPEGRIFFVEDHSAPGTGTSATNTLHRIDAEAVKQQVAAAGLVLEGESDLLHNPNDPHDVSPREVQPTSDKFALRFRKPERR